MKSSISISVSSRSEAKVGNSPSTIISVGFVLTDGQTKHKDKLLVEVDRLRELNVTIYSIGVGKACPDDAIEYMDSCVNTTEMEIISGSQNRTHHVDRYDELKDIMEV